MPAHKSSVKVAPTDTPIVTDNVLRAAAGMHTVRSRLLATTLRVLPWLALIIALLVLFPGNLFRAYGPQLFGTGVLTVVLVLFAFQTLLACVPETLSALWRRRLILAKTDQSDMATEKDSEQAVDPKEQHVERYVAYIKEFEDLLNNKRWQVGMIIAFELLVNLWLGFLNLNFLRNLIRGDIGFVSLAELVIDMTLAALLAPMAWRLIVIGWKIWRLPEEFDLKVQFEHPDQCGGLEPLGSLCLWNILIISLPLIFLGSWLLIARTDTSSFSFHSSDLWASVQKQANAYADIYAQLLWVLIPFTILGFVLPLWNTHRVMVEKRRKLLVQLDEHVENITDEWNAAVQKIGHLTTAEGNEKLGKLEFARQIYERQKRLPVWPINLNIFLKFASTQAIPWLSLTGIGPGIIKVVDLIIELVTPSS